MDRQTNSYRVACSLLNARSSHLIYLYCTVCLYPVATFSNWLMIRNDEHTDKEPNDRTRTSFCFWKQRLAWRKIRRNIETRPDTQPIGSRCWWAGAVMRVGRGSIWVIGGCIDARQERRWSEIRFSVDFASSKFSRFTQTHRHTDQGTHPFIESLRQRLKMLLTKNSKICFRIARKKNKKHLKWMFRLPNYIT